MAAFLSQTCTCTDTVQYFFVWTLTINELNYSKSDCGPCGTNGKAYYGTSSTKTCQSTLVPTVVRNATVAKIYLKLFPHPSSPSCLEDTVKCAIQQSPVGQRVYDMS